ELVTTIVADYLRDPSTMPDAGLAPEIGPIMIVVEITNGPPLRLDRLPHGPRPIAITTLDGMQHDANTRDQRIGFLRIAIDFDRDHNGAAVSRGGDIAIPATSKVIKMCCCSSSQHYHRVAGGWQASQFVLSVCG